MFSIELPNMLNNIWQTTAELLIITADNRRLRVDRTAVGPVPSAMLRSLRIPRLSKSPILGSPLRRPVSSLCKPCLLGGRFSPEAAGAPPEAAVPGEFLKWASVGFCRGSKFATGFTPLQPKPLESIIDLERAKSCSPEDLVSVWDDYHLGRGHIGTSMKAKLYRLLEERSINCKHFVIPLWRGSGYTTMFVQVQMPHMIFTGLEDYKARGTQASPYFTITHYTDFAESQGVVLVRGDVVFTSKLSDSEARWLLEAAQSFYLNDARYKLVERFNKETHEFEFKDVLQALEMPSM